MPDFQIGDPAPDFELLTDSGQPVKLSDYRGKRVILYFYPKDDTPGCTIQACGFRDHHAEIEAKNGVVLGISPDDQSSHQQFKTKFNLPFTLLVDTDHRIADQYGVWGEKSYAGKTYMGVIRSHFVVGPDGRFEDVQVKISPENSVEFALKSLG